ncbi:STAS domain-containing protein [Streptomyces sp. NPDC058818]|uniref:STAS domain-containing protein n=1 Tax=Streptomyces sp. NPDC058818 TaxID=3346640 RepID=UPI00369B54A2
MTETFEPRDDTRLSVHRTSISGVRILTLHGEIDHTTAPQLGTALTPDSDDTPLRAVLDLGTVTFMDSSGVNALITAHQAAQSAQGWLRLAAPTPTVLRVLQLVGLDTVIPCYPTLREALRAD